MRKVLIALPVLLIVSCQAPRKEGPPAVQYGRAECARCGMIVNEQRFASGYISEQGQNVVFDDMGEFFKDIRPAVDNYPRLYVQDMYGGGWVRATNAFYVRAPGLATPMGSGVVAFKDKEKAAQFAAGRNVKEVYDFESALKAFD